MARRGQGVPRGQSRPSEENRRRGKGGSPASFLPGTARVLKDYGRMKTRRKEKRGREAPLEGLHQRGSTPGCQGAQSQSQRRKHPSRRARRGGRAK